MAVAVAWERTVAVAVAVAEGSRQGKEDRTVAVAGGHLRSKASATERSSSSRGKKTGIDRPISL